MCDCNSDYKTCEDYFGKDTLDEIFSYVEEWPSENWKCTIKAQLDIKQGVSEIVQHLVSICNDDVVLQIIPNVVERNVLKIVHEHLMLILYERFKEPDQIFYEKCKRLNGMNLAYEAFGSTKISDVQLTASIVEMANLDTYADPKSKLDCLVSCFDLIYAELKMVIAEEIADTGKENEIPIVDNADVFPLLISVIIKTKPIHFYSNMEYIRLFCNGDNLNQITSGIIDIFNEASAKILNIRPGKIFEGKLKNELNHEDLNEIMMGANTAKNNSTRRIKMVSRQIFDALDNI